MALAAITLPKEPSASADNIDDDDNYDDDDQDQDEDNNDVDNNEHEDYTGCLVIIQFYDEYDDD